MSERTRILSGNQLKILACVSMFSDHAVKALGVRGFARFFCAHIFGRIAFPIFCFFLAEGFFHTRDRRLYLLRMVLFAALSEIPFNMALHRAVVYPHYQNTLWALSLGLAMYLCLAYVEKFRDMPFSVSVVLRGALIAGFAAAAHYLHVDYHARGLLCMAMYYYMHNRRPHSLAALWGGVIQNLNGFKTPGAFLAAVPLHFYSEKRGTANLKYFFYFFYPLHLLLLLAIKLFLL